MATAKRSKLFTIEKEYEETILPENKKFFDRYVRDMKMRCLSDKSIYSYKRDILMWLSYVNKHQNNLSVLEITEEDLEEFIFACQEFGNNTQRIKRRISAISAFFKFLRKKKHVKENPCEFISRPKKGLPVVKQTFLTFEQVDLMKRELRKLGDKQLETYAMLSLSTMGRVTAISNIKWEQIDIENRTIDNVLEKEGKIVTLFFDKYTQKLLRELEELRDFNNIQNEYVFLKIKNGNMTNCVWEKVTSETLFAWTKKIGKIIGVPSLHPHDFRHSGSQLLNLKGMPLEDISELLNHSGLDVTKNHYLQQDKKKMKATKDKYSF